MRAILQYLLVFLFLFNCQSGREVLDTGELVLEFENIWWETPDESLLAYFNEPLCFSFNTTMYEDQPIDGKLIFFLEGGSFSYPISEFERTNDGYYLPEYDIDIKILIDDDENYTAKIKSGILSKSVEINPCTLG